MCLKIYTYTHGMTRPAPCMSPNAMYDVATYSILNRKNKYAHILYLNTELS